MGNRKWPEDAGIGKLVELAERHQLIQPTIKGYIENAKRYRDLIHPVNAARTTLRVDQPTVEMVIRALQMILSDLEAARSDGRITKYEQAS